MKRLAVHWQILAALAIATTVALVFRMLAAKAGTDAALTGVVNATLGACAFVGDLFMRALKMIIVPLIVTSVVSGIASLQGVKGFGRLGLKTAAFYAGSSLVAILLILKNSGIPEADAAVVALLAVDRLLDMSRTAVNVFSDSCAAVFVARSEGEMLSV